MPLLIRATKLDMVPIADAKLTGPAIGTLLALMSVATQAIVAAQINESTSSTNESLVDDTAGLGRE